MNVMNVNDKKDQKVDSYPYKGKPLKVEKVLIRWLTQAGPEGAPEYGLRLFTIGPGGFIPVHNHLYYQTMYILTGRLLMMSHDPETDRVVEEKTVRPHDFIFVPTMEPHSMKNLSAKEDVTLLCCIANVYEKEGI